MKNNIYIGCLLFLTIIVTSCGSIHSDEDEDCGCDEVYADLSLVLLRKPDLLKIKTRPT